MNTLARSQSWCKRFIPRYFGNSHEKNQINTHSEYWTSYSAKIYKAYLSLPFNSQVRINLNNMAIEQVTPKYLGLYHVNLSIQQEFEYYKT